MSKKPLEDDLLAGGTIADGKDKSAKKAEKAAAKAKKQKEKNDAKRTALKKCSTMKSSAPILSKKWPTC